MTRIAVVDHGAGNLVSVTNALTEVGADVHLATNAAGLAGADGVVLPGVGHTGAAMRNLLAEGLVDPLKELDVPLLGICVGLQLFFEGSDEDEEPCLGIMDGRVQRLTDAPTLPHMGWNAVAFDDEPLFTGLPDGTPFYFVHSYAPRPRDERAVVATTTHGERFCVAARRGPVVGTQFHPERSGSAGLQVLSNWLDEVGRAA